MNGRMVENGSLPGMYDIIKKEQRQALCNSRHTV